MSMFSNSGLVVTSTNAINRPLPVPLEALVYWLFSMLTWITTSLNKSQTVEACVYIKVYFGH